MGKLVTRLVRAGLRRGFRDGVLDGNRAWIVIGGVALLAHLGGRAMGGDPDVVFLEQLKPGESFLITNRPND